MRVKMKTTKPGYPTPGDRREYKEGQSYEVPEHLGNTFLNAGWATRLEDLPEPEPEPEPVNDEVVIKPTSQGSPYYKFLMPGGEPLTDSEGNVVKVLGEKAAKQKRDELQAELDAEDE